MSAGDTTLFALGALSFAATILWRWRWRETHWPTLIIGVVYLVCGALL